MTAIRARFVPDGAGGLRPAMGPEAFRAAFHTLAGVDPHRYLEAPGHTLLFVASVGPGADDIEADETDDLHAVQAEALKSFTNREGHSIVDLPGSSHEILPKAGDKVAMELARWLSSLGFYH